MPNLCTGMIGSPPSIVAMPHSVCCNALFFPGNYGYNFSEALLLYDWLLCFDQEVACIWRASGGLNAGSLVYALSRFPLTMGMVFTTATIFPLSVLVSNSVLSLVKYCCLCIYRGKTTSHGVSPVLRFSYWSHRTAVASSSGHSALSPCSLVSLLEARVLIHTSQYPVADYVLHSVFDIPCFRCIREKSRTNTSCISSLYCPNHHQPCKRFTAALPEFS